MNTLPQEMIFTPSDFVREYNAALEAVFPLVIVEGELLNFKVAQNKWVYADIADEGAKIRLFGSVFNLLHQLSDGMKVRVIAQPRLHPLYGLSLNIESITPIGEGNIKKAAEELARKLSAEGLFDESRKRPLPRYPKRIGLISSLESAAYADFIKIMNARWRGVEVVAYHSSVQGESAPAEICRALDTLNSYVPTLDVIVLIRGGGSPEDLQAFSAESVVRAVANSRVPTIAGIGHEIDVSLTELAADVSASTPSNVAELLFPDVRDEARNLSARAENLQYQVKHALERFEETIKLHHENLVQLIDNALEKRQYYIDTSRNFLSSTNPMTLLSNGYSIITDEKNQVVVSSKSKLLFEENYIATFHDGSVKIKRSKKGNYS